MQNVFVSFYYSITVEFMWIHVIYLPILLKVVWLDCRSAHLAYVDIEIYAAIAWKIAIGRI